MEDRREGGREERESPLLGVGVVVVGPEETLLGGLPLSVVGRSVDRLVSSLCKSIRRQLRVLQRPELLLERGLTAKNVDGGSLRFVTTNARTAGTAA